MLTVSANDLDFDDEDDPMHEVYYQGKPFTGVAWSGLETTEYVEGRAHGRYEIRFRNGSLSAEGRYVAGECTEMRTWYEDGPLRETYQTSPLTINRWDRDGVLAFAGADDENGIYHTRWFYKNGTVKQHYMANKGTDYFANDGQLAMQVTYGRPLNSVRYSGEVLKTSYLDVLTKYHYELEMGKETANVEWYFWGWVWQLLGRASDRPTALAILHHLKTEGFDTANQILAKIRTIDLATFKPALSYQIKP